MIRVILYRVEAKPQVISVSPNAAGGYSTAIEELLGGPVACVPLHDGIQLCCNRGGLLFGLPLTRRALALSLAEPTPDRRSGLPMAVSCRGVMRQQSRPLGIQRRSAGGL